MTAWVIGNWKLNPITLKQAISLAEGIAKHALELPYCQLIIAPSPLHTAVLAKQLNALNISVAGQNITSLSADSGAYTGDFSAAQLEDIGVKWVILGHSERREYYNESNEDLQQKFQYCQDCHLGVIFCVGESQQEYEAGQTQAILKKQLEVVDSYLNKINKQATMTNEILEEICSSLIIAYEPVWAIGTGKIPTVDEVAKTHAFIRDVLGDINENLTTLPILYGGSVKPENAEAFASSTEINGVLVGGAALSADSFIAIAQAFANADSTLTKK